ncbi:hypothetical protein MFTT_47920 [Mycolicibacterium fortuitum subsp. fortuitum]|nr:hypothetical protein G155_23725 [Mycobacterium sp. VKM Ac-1817D]BDE00699.1 hypothetical protein MFTT_47920 [Mycolicibacterium fortuitum subsp. fortuitum]
MPISYSELALLEPKAAVLLMFNHLEGLLKRSFKHQYPDERQPDNVAALTKKLVSKGVIDARLKGRLDDLRERRNRIAHDDPRVTHQEADHYFNSLGDALHELTHTSLYR